jgi:pilus assembly protein CpaB
MSIFKNRSVVGVLCILLSLLICFGITPLFNRAVSEKTEIVRVVRNQVRRRDHGGYVQDREVGRYGLPDNVVRKTDSVVGKYAAADLSIGDYILITKLTDTPAAENAYLYSLDGKKQAMSVTIKSSRRSIRQAPERRYRIRHRSRL